MYSYSGRAGLVDIYLPGLDVNGPVAFLDCCRSIFYSERVDHHACSLAFSVGFGCMERSSSCSFHFDFPEEDGVD